MITYSVQRTTEYAENKAKKHVEGICLSTDTKPTESIENGSTLLEMDTSTLYFYDEAGKTWRAW